MNFKFQKSMPLDRLVSRARIILAVTAALVATVTAAAQGAGASPEPKVSIAISAPTNSTIPTYYVSLGDSYAAGNQPTTGATAGTDTNGFAYQVVRLAAAKGDQFRLENFACDGATSATLLDQRGCSLAPPGPDTATYGDKTQATAAEQFISAHRSQIGLITVSIGGNDLLACSAASIVISCSRGAAKSIAKNLTTLLTGLRQSAGASVPIVGITYPDVFLGLYRAKDPAQKKLATLSIQEFRQIFNPALRSSYLAAGARFVDVTAATGAYTPLTKTTVDPPFGTVPVAVADVCNLTYYCQLQDVHPTKAGYALIAGLIVATLKPA
jgi:lysophospholipase L1-like esterase